MPEYRKQEDMSGETTSRIGFDNISEDIQYTRVSNDGDYFESFNIEDQDHNELMLAITAVCHAYFMGRQPNHVSRRTCV